MASNNIFLHIVQLIISVRILKSCPRMGKSVKSLSFCRLHGMPVIEKIIMKQGPSHYISCVPFEIQGSVQGKACDRYVLTMLINGRIAMLNMVLA